MNVFRVISCFFQMKKVVLSIGGSKTAETVKRTSKTIRRKQAAHEGISTGIFFSYFYSQLLNMQTNTSAVAMNFTM